MRERGTEKEVAREGKRAIERERARERRDSACARVRVCARNLNRVGRDVQQQSQQCLAASEEVCRCGETDRRTTYLNPPARASPNDACACRVRGCLMSRTG